MILILTMQGSLFALVGASGEAIYIATAICICIIMARELIISAFRQIAATSGVVMAADMLGKYKTTFQDISLVVLMVAVDLTGNAQLILAWVGLALFAIATILTVWSGISYVVKNKQVLKDA